MSENNSTASIIKGIGYAEIVAGVILGLVMFADYEAIVAIIIIIASFVSGVLLIGFGEVIELLHQINRGQKKQPHTNEKEIAEECITDSEKEEEIPEVQGSNTLAGVKYYGDTKNGIPHGQGTMYKPDLEKYVGEFEDGKYHGKGTRYKPNVKPIIGRWENGEYVGE